MRERAIIIVRVSRNDVERLLLAPDKQDGNGSDGVGHQQSSIIVCVLCSHDVVTTFSASLKCFDSADYASDLELFEFYGSIRRNVLSSQVQSVKNI